MLQKLKIRLFSLSALFVLAAPAAVPVMASAQTDADIQNSVCTGADKLEIPPGANPSVNCANLDSGDEGRNRINDIIAKVINIFSVIVGAVAVVMIIIGGFRYVTSGGDSAKVGAAKNTILYALIGLIIVALSQVIVRFILNRAATT